jgi:PIN domain nuclease of toxin-antitoxin system
MKILCDSNILIFAAMDELPPIARQVINDEDNALYYSAAAIWEISIKYSSGKLKLPCSPRVFKEQLDSNGYREVRIDSEHALATSDLDNNHKDPFDRIMIAQAQKGEMKLLTTDEALSLYGDAVLWVRN